MPTLKAMIKIFEKYSPIVDEFINTNRKLSFINSNLQTHTDPQAQTELQDKIFASANRSNVAYYDMVNAISNMASGDSFSSNDEMIAFTELAQKSLKIGGANQSEQSSAMMQLTKSMSSGGLQGDEFKSIMENAPVIANAITEYTGKSISELEKLGSQGLITSDIIKNAMFAAGDEINDEFNSMDKTFADVWNRIKNGAIKAFVGVFEKVNDLINTNEFNQMAAGVINTFAVIAAVVTEIFNVISSIGSWAYENWSILEPIIWGVIAAMIAWKIATLTYTIITGIAEASLLGHIGAIGLAIATKSALTGATIEATAAQWSFNSALFTCPILWITAAVIALAVCFVIFTEQIIGAIWWLGALFKNLGLWIANLGIAIWEGIKNIGLWFANLGLGIWEVLKACAYNIGSAFKNLWSNVQIGFLNLVVTILSGVLSIANKMNSLLGVFGIKIDTSGIESQIKNLADKKATLENGKADYKDIGDAWNRGFNTYEYGSVGDAFNTFDTFEKGWGSDAYATGAEVGAGINDWIDNNLSMNALLKKFGANGDNSDASEDKNKGFDMSEFGASNNPLTVKGTGANGKVDINMADEDLQYLRDIAERDYVNKFSTATLAPNIQISFGDIHEEADANNVAGRIRKILQEEIATTAEGVYDV